MGFELQIAGFVLLGISLLSSAATTAALWPGRQAPGIRAWIVGLWLGSLGTYLLTIPSERWDASLALLRNGAQISASGCLAMGTAAFLGRRAAYTWVPASILAAVPFILHWIPGLSPFASRAGIVSFGVGAWMGWGAWQWLSHGRAGYRGAALFLGGLFAFRAAFNLTRSIYLFTRRPGSLGEVEWLQGLVYMESSLFFVVLGLALWVASTLQGRLQRKGLAG